MEKYNNECDRYFVYSGSVSNIKSSFSKADKKKKTAQRPIISEPQGDLRHTYHLGIDGDTFEISDKKHLPRHFVSPCTSFIYHKIGFIRQREGANGGWFDIYFSATETSESFDFDDWFDILIDDVSLEYFAGAEGSCTVAATSRSGYPDVWSEAIFTLLYRRNNCIFICRTAPVRTI